MTHTRTALLMSAVFASSCLLFGELLMLSHPLSSPKMYLRSYQSAFPILLRACTMSVYKACEP